MRRIDYRVYHCSATHEGRDVTLQEIDSWHRARGFRKIGYHFLVHIDGSIDIGRTLDEVGAHAKGYNTNSVGICYIGGLDNEGRPKDTRTVAQIHALRALDAVLQSLYPDSVRVGHRDLSVDLNGDGVISRQEWMKECPCFDAKNDF